MKRIGLIGAGQLGRMTIEACRPLLGHISVLSPDYPSPAGVLADEVYVGELEDYNAIMELADETDILSYEIEHVNTDALHDLELSGKTVIPPSYILTVIKDKQLQKTMLEQAGIPSAPWIPIELMPEAYTTGSSNTVCNAVLKSVQALGGFPVVQKARRGGYDGRGVAVLNSLDDKLLLVPSFVEKKIEIDKELAVLCAVDTFGNTAVYPCVEMVFDARANLCDSVLMPARITEKQHDEAVAIARRTIEALRLLLADHKNQLMQTHANYTPVFAGIFAVEMFLAKDGSILVNEIAPRPHNSGHVTIENCVTSQFMQYYRILAGYSLGSTEMVCPGMMINLLGEPGASGTPRYVGIEEALRVPGVSLHLYGKTEVKPFRKMGHLTAIAPTVEEAIRRAELAREKIKILSE
ncbi:MAG TPA: 5-(carboxyamino)imidazole ribonucleotide synthase [Spirochaetia bacterium]|nr:5-(carboxyamino)imidazole ribonucleotide synthase [Spirochaetia bacterium]